jgi:hypothetical protein
MRQAQQTKPGHVIVRRPLTQLCQSLYDMLAERMLAAGWIYQGADYWGCGAQKLVMQQRGKCGVTQCNPPSTGSAAIFGHACSREWPCFAAWRGLAQRAVRSPAIVIGDVRG